MILDEQGQDHSAWYIEKWKDFFAASLDQTRSGQKEEWYDRSWLRMISICLSDNQGHLMAAPLPPALTKTTIIPGSEAVTTGLVATDLLNPVSDEDFIDSVKNEKKQHIKERLDREDREREDVFEEQKRNRVAEKVKAILIGQGVPQ